LVRDGHAFEMVVRTGVTRDQRIALLEELTPETLVVLNPPAALHDGSAVTTTVAATPSAAGNAHAENNAH